MIESAQINPILVTGASGFVGNCVVRRLLAHGRENVHVLLRQSAKMWRFSGICDKVEIHEGDVQDESKVTEIMRRVRPAAVLHLATYGAYEAQADARTILETNCIGTYNLLQASLNAGVQIFVNTGSSSEYGYRSEPMQESDRIEPNSIYAVAKAAQTHICSLLSKKSETDVVSFRLFSVYGPWEEPARLIPTIVRRARAGEELHMVAPDTARDFIYVDDVVDALLNFSKFKGMKGDVFNLGTGRQSTLREVVAAVLQAVGSTSPVKWEAMPARKWDTSQWQANPQKVRDVLGFSPRFSLEEGIREMADWMRRVGDNYGPP